MTAKPAGSANVPEQELVAEAMAARVPRGFRATTRQVAGDFNLLRKTKYGITPLLVIFVVTTFQGIDDSIRVVLLPEIRKDFNGTLVQFTVFAQLFTFVALAGVPVVGYLVDRSRRTVLVAVSAVLSAVCSVFSTFAGSVMAYQGISSAGKVAQQLGDVPAHAMLFDYYPIEARAKTVSVRRIVGLFVGPLTTVTVGVIATKYGWRFALRVVAVPLALSGLLVLVKLRDPVRGYWERLRAGEDEATAEQPQPPMRFGEAFRTLMAIKTLRRLLVIMPILTVAGGGFTTLYNFYLVEQFHLSPLQRSLIHLPGTAFAIVALVVGSALADTLIKKNPGRVLFLNSWIGVIVAITHVLIVVFPSLVLVIVFGIITGFLQVLIEPALVTASSLVMPPRLRGQGMSVIVLLVLPTIPFAVLPAYAADHLGTRPALLLYAPFFVVASLISLSAARFFNVDQRAAVASANATNEYNRAKAEGKIKLLVVRDVDVSYDAVQVLFGVDLTVEDGEIVALLGTNGAGKSTLLRAISGVREAGNGAILFDGRNITHLPPHEIARLGVVHMPGGRATFPSLTIRENLDLARLALDDTDDVRARLERVFEFFPVLRERLDQTAASLSGGEQQMVGLAQAFLWKPRLLMIDELSLGLAPAVVSKLLDIVRAINADGAAVVLVEQSVNVSLTVAERAVFMEKGEVRFDGPTADLLHRPDIMRAVYLKGSASLTAVARRREPVVVEHGRPLLEVEGVSLGYGGVRALDDVTFTLYEGQALGLIGPNGAGKTTLFDVVSGYVAPDAGTVRFDGVDVTAMRPEERGRIGLVRRFQDAALFGALTVREAICLALDKQHAVRSVYASALPLGPVRKGEARVRARADAVIELLELGGQRDKLVADLSTGQRRVVDLACVIAASPRLLLLDEPSTGVAQAEAENLAPLLGRVRRETGASLLVIEHDMPLARRLCDELIALVNGHPVVRGTPDDVLEHPDVVAAYLGDNTAAFARSGALVR